MSDLVLRWCVGDYDTTTRSPMSFIKLLKFLRMAKLSVYSFQHFFDADFVICWNGDNDEKFRALWDAAIPELPKPVKFVYQREVPNPYPFFVPLGGVWWKWIPFRYDPSKTEISIDTDILCLRYPESWYDWLNNDVPTLVPYEAISEICESTCGTVWEHAVLKDKRALNCGIIGQKAGTDLTKRFFQLTELVDYGSYHGNFVTEQGLFNILFYSLQDEGVLHHALPYDLNLQAKHLMDMLSKGVPVETVHFTARTKLIFYDLYETFKQRIDGKVFDLWMLSELIQWYASHKDLLN